jgi:hypothetical protein
MSVLLLVIKECGIFVLKFKTVGALRFCSTLLCSAPALLYSDLLLLCTLSDLYVEAFSLFYSLFCFSLFCSPFLKTVTASSSLLFVSFFCSTRALLWLGFPLLSMFYLYGEAFCSSLLCSSLFCSVLL